MKLYDEAGSLRRLAAAMGVSKDTARARLVKAGIPIRDPRGVANWTKKAPPPSDEERATWQRLYDDAGSVAELARRIGKSTATAQHHLRRHGVEVRRDGFKSPRTVATALGAEHHNWKGGRSMHSDGYVLVYAPWHPAGRNSKGYVLEHRLVMERLLGRYLTPRELVHHKNEVKDDNRPENLEIMTRSNHMSHHKDGFPRDGNGRFSVA